MRLYYSIITTVLLFGIECIAYGQQYSEQEDLKSAVIEFTSSDLPIIVLDTQGKSIKDEPKTNIHMGIINNQNARNELTDSFNDYDGTIGIEIRGSSSQGYPKKNYGFETRTKTGENNNVSLLGLPEENDWVLHGPYSDKSLIRNALTFQLGNDMGRWAPRTKFCELFINSDYRGVYVLMEKIKKDKNRVDISTLNPDELSGDDLTGGYILRIDRRESDSWISNYRGYGGYPIYFSLIYPDPDDIPQIQKDYITNYLNDFEDALFGPDFKDKSIGYQAYINYDSFVDYCLINELTKNVDAYKLSTYFYKDKDSKGGKFTMGPLWDYNFSWGNVDYYGCDDPEGWILDKMSTNDDCAAPFWWDRIREDNSFNLSLKEKWFSLRQDVFSESHIFLIIDYMYEILSEAQQRNFDHFSILNRYIWPNAYIGGSYNNEIQYLKNFISQRLVWMDGQFEAVTDNKESIAERSDKAYFYPNPFTDNLKLKISTLKTSKIDIKLYDIIGKLVLHKDHYTNAGYNEISFENEIHNLEKGLYIYEIMAGQTKIGSGKLLKK